MFVCLTNNFLIMFFSESTSDKVEQQQVCVCYTLLLLFSKLTYILTVHVFVNFVLAINIVCNVLCSINFRIRIRILMGHAHYNH